jgi:hypothetical protein
VTTPPEFRSSLVLIGSRLSTDQFGTGFIVEQTGATTRIVTCRHVVLDNGGVEQIRIVGDPKITLLGMGDDPAFDLAVLEVTPPLPGTPLPIISRQTTESIVLEGYRNIGETYLRQPSLGNVIRPSAQISKKTGEEVGGWEFAAEELYRLEPGNSGSPVIDRSFCAAFGVANARSTDGKTGLIVAISNLPRIWAPARGLFLDKRIILFAHPNDKQVVDAMLASLVDKIDRPVFLHLWGETPLDTFVVEACDILIIAWSQSLQADCSEIIHPGLGKRAQAKRRVIPVTVDQSNRGAAFDQFLPQNIWCEYTKGGDTKRLIWAIEGKNPDQPTLPHEPPGPDPELNNDSTLADLAAGCAKGAVTFIVGCALPREADLVVGLISKAGLRSADVFLPIDLVGTCYSFRNSDAQLENEMRFLHTLKQIAAPYYDLCRIVEKVLQRPVGRLNAPPQRQLIVTTNLDLALEAALLQTGIPFLRIVHDRSSIKLHVSNFTDDDAKYTRGRSIEEVFEHAASVDPTVVEQTLEDHNLGNAQNPLQNLSLGNAKVILYKLLGTNDIDRSAVLTTEQLHSYLPGLQNGYARPVAVTKILNNTDLLLLGYGHMDFSFRVVLQLLASLDGKRHRYMIQSCPSPSEFDPLRKIERDLWPKMTQRRAIEQRIETVENDSDLFVRTLSTMVAG